MEPVMIYQPRHEQRFRVTWYGGESSQLHFERREYDTDDHTFVWKDIDVRSLMHVPTQVKEMLIEMEDYWHQAIILEDGMRYAMCD